MRENILIVVFSIGAILSIYNIYKGYRMDASQIDTKELASDYRNLYIRYHIYCLVLFAVLVLDKVF